MWTGYLSDLWRDAVYGLRTLVRAPGFTRVGVLSLTLGIGICSVFFSEVNSMVLRPLPAAPHPEALVAVIGAPTGILLSLQGFTRRF